MWNISDEMGEIIKEWTKSNLWKTGFKKFYLVYPWILCPGSPSTETRPLLRSRKGSFATIVNYCYPLTIVAKLSILMFARVLATPLFLGNMIDFALLRNQSDLRRQWFYVKYFTEGFRVITSGYWKTYFNAISAKSLLLWIC